MHSLATASLAAVGSSVQSGPEQQALLRYAAALRALSRQQLCSPAGWQHLRRELQRCGQRAAEQWEAASAAAAAEAGPGREQLNLALRVGQALT